MAIRVRSFLDYDMWVYGTSAQHSAVVKITNVTKEILRNGENQRVTRTIKSMEKFSIQGATE